MPLTLVTALILASSLAGQVPSPYKQPNWAKGSWKFEDSKFRRIRSELDDIKFGPSRQPKRIKELYRLHVQPHLRLLQTRTKVFGPIDPEIYYWATALYAYYPVDGAELGYDIGYLLNNCSGPDSYEFARVAFCVYALEVNYAPALIDLADRLLKRDPKDALVRTYFLRTARLVKKPSKALADRAVAIVEGLSKEFPHRRVMYGPMLADAYRFHFGTTFTKASYERTVKCYEAVIKDPAVRDENRKALQSDLKYLKHIVGKFKFKG